MTLETNGRNAAIDAVTALLNGGSLVFRTAGDVEVATLPLSATAFGAGAVGVATANAITTDSSATGGTTTKGTLETSGGVKVATLTVGTSGTEIILDNNVVAAGVSVAVTSLTLTQPAA